MRDLPLRVNEVVFRPFQEIEIPQEGFDIWTTWPQAGKYDFLLGRLHLLQEEMFALAATTQPSEQVMREISERNPDSCISDILERITKHENKDFVPLAAVIGDPQSLMYHDRQILQASLLRLTSHANFTERLRSWSWFIDILGFLTSRPRYTRGSELITRERRWTVFYRVDKYPSTESVNDGRSADQLSYMELEDMRLIVSNTQWRPWIVPTEQEMTKLRDLFESRCPTHWSSFQDRLPGLRYYQSATSQAIRFLDGLPPQYRKQMSESPYMKRWWTNCDVSDAVLRTVTWINEATSLSLGGNARPPFRTHFVGPFDTVQLVWNKVKDVAALYTAATACTQAQRSPFPTRDDLALVFANYGDAAYSDPELLPASVRHILSGNSLVQFPCIIGTLDEFDEECQYVSTLLQDRNKEDWEAYRNSILEGIIEEEGVDFKTVQSRYADHRPRAM
ncbi:uncharacterized protein J4E79_011529 [Alternaria viburni]|uniref:uncharacterized protein n=1 Tax=Alternaria viburni TaxID=566460 RepID=UPI0020C2B25F|nr:uncharacterized protein J4E79_011529 [Alternaria viburni]KAI4642467.1 hypothetical protein J4E79_011529 [Alternaria viburni]